MTVYYVRAENGAIKIGYTNQNVNKRFASLSTASPLSLELVAYEDGSFDTERERHDEYVDFNIRGEWFIPCDQLNERIKSLNSNYKPIMYLDKSDYEIMTLEKDRLFREISNTKSWYLTDGIEPPKLFYVSLLFCILYVTFVLYLANPLNIGDGFIAGFTALLYPIAIPGFVLGNIWHTKRIFSYFQ